MTLWECLLAPLLSVSPARLVQAAFILTSCGALAITVAPAAQRKLLLNYGPRMAQQPPNPSENEKNDVRLPAFNKIASLAQVPHSWFFTYYVFYILCAGFWAVQYVQKGGSYLQVIAVQQANTAPGSSTMSGTQVAVVWCTMLLQAGRRLYECWAVMKPSKSTMLFAHWVLGMGFYLGVSVAIWVEGSTAILQGQVRFSGGDMSAADPMVKAAVALPMFWYGWVMQHRCHRQLAGLRKYSLPDQGMFRHIVCPHYTCECLIYLSLAIIAAPEGHWCNKTLLSVLTFVAVNLGVTAYGTKSWYAGKFGQEQVMSRWIMVPFLY